MYITFMYLKRQSSSSRLLISFIFSINEIFCINFSSYESVKNSIILFVNFVVTFYQCVYFQDI